MSVHHPFWSYLHTVHHCSSRHVILDCFPILILENDTEAGPFDSGKGQTLIIFLSVAPGRPSWSWATPRPVFGRCPHRPCPRPPAMESGESAPASGQSGQSVITTSSVLSPFLFVKGSATFSSLWIFTSTHYVDLGTLKAMGHSRGSAATESEVLAKEQINWRG